MTPGPSEVLRPPQRQAHYVRMPEPGTTRVADGEHGTWGVRSADPRQSRRREQREHGHREDGSPELSYSSAHLADGVEHLGLEDLVLCSDVRPDAPIETQNLVVHVNDVQVQV
jgi:hypothetical protein